eukprot:SAG31_NODE_3767_length_3902_cov_1.591375_3_plen_148_part_00
MVSLCDLRSAPNDFQDTGGFFVAVLEKVAPTPRGLSKQQAVPHAEAGSTVAVASKRRFPNVVDPTVTYTTTTTISLPDGRVVKHECKTRPRRSAAAGGSNRNTGKHVMNKKEQMELTGAVKGVRGRVIDLEELRYYPVALTDVMVRL